MNLLNLLSSPPCEKNGWPWTEEINSGSYQEGVNWPKISIVTPSFNQGEYIEETIRSILLQNYPNLEYFIIDGGSTDNTIEIIKKYEPWITYWVSEEDRGQTHAINKGVEKCSGEVFNWLNSDDYYTKGALQQVGECYANNAFHLLCCREYSFNSTTRFLSDPTKIYFNNLEKTLHTAYFNQPCCFFSFNVLKRCFPINEDLHYLMDADLFRRFLLHNGFGKVFESDFVTTNFRLHETSKTVSLNRMFHHDRLKLNSTLYQALGIPFSILKKINCDIEKGGALYDLRKIDQSKLADIVLDSIVHTHSSSLSKKDCLKLFRWAIYTFPRRNLKGYLFLFRRILIHPMLRTRILNRLKIA